MTKVALIRGRYLTKYEMQTYELLRNKYDITAFGSLSAYHKSFKFKTRLLASPVDLIGLSDKIYFPQRLMHGALNRLFIDSQFLLGLEKNLQGFDIAHTAETYFGFTHQAVIAKRKGYIRRLISTVNENIAQNNEGIRGRIKFKHDALEEVDHFLAVSDMARDVLIQEGCQKEKITVIPRGIDTKLFHPPQKPKSQKDKIRLLFVGRLEIYKGAYDLIDAFEILIDKYPSLKSKIELILSGEGSEKEKIKKQIIEKKLAPHITITNTPYEDIPALYQSADIFIAPSQATKYWQEQFGMMLLEALSSGLPILTTNTGSIQETVGNAAIFTPQANPKHLSDILYQLFKNPGLRIILGKKSRQRALKYFDSRIIAEKIDDVYQKILK